MGRRDAPGPGGAAAWGGRHEATGFALAGAAALAVVIAWEVARPTLPVPYELAAAARAPGTPAWLGRLPMAAAAAAGMAAVYIFLARAVEKRAGVYAVAVLATVPAWFVHGRTMTGAIVPMACSAVVLAGAGIAVLDANASAKTRTAGAVAAAAATLVAVTAIRFGIPNRGLVAVAAVPLVAVGAAGALWKARWAAAPLLAGVALVVTGIVVAACALEGPLAELVLGARASRPGGATTFDAPVAVLAYGLVPWTPFVPFALVRRPKSAGHLAVSLCAVLSIAVHAALAPRTGTSTVVGVASIAAAVAVMLRSLEETRRPSIALVATAGVVGWLVAHDIALSPDRVLVAFGAAGAAIPTTHAAASSMAVRSSLWLCMVLSGVALLTPRTWLPAGRGLAVVGAGVFAGLALRAHAYPELLGRLSPGAAFDAWARRHRAGEPLGILGLDRRAVAFAPGTAVAPQSDAPSAGRWLAAGAHGVPDEPRRFLALAAAELAPVNAAYRAVHARNVPILAGQEGTTLLAASALASGERSENPLDAVVTNAPPPALRPLGAVLEGRLEAVGWQLVDERGRTLDAVPHGTRKAHVRIVLRVPAAANAGAAAFAPMHGYCTFLHVDHSPSRFSAEHRELAYPMGLWREGDVVSDDFDVKLPAHFRAGSYRMYFGVGALPCEDDRRMHVTSGPTDGRDRIPAGPVEVR